MNNLVSKNLSAMRRERELSLDQLAELAGVSKSMLRQIEVGKSSPTIAMLWKIANGLRVPLTALLREDSPEVVVQGFFEGVPIAGNNEGHRLSSLVTFDPDQPFEIYHMELDVGAVLESEAHNGQPREYLFVTHGTVQVTIDGADYLVDRNQFVKFRADFAHIYRNVGDEMARAIVLVSY